MTSQYKIFNFVVEKRNLTYEQNVVPTVVIYGRHLEGTDIPQEVPRVLVVSVGFVVETRNLIDVIDNYEVNKKVLWTESLKCTNAGMMTFKF